ncbi:MAG: cytochrome c [Anaerolineae bacterium]|nr:cytochrome c [Anaerolineae bacterium]
MLRRLLLYCSLLLIFTACAPPELNNHFEELSPGDASSGEKLFLQSIDDAPTCASCHALDGSRLIGPSLQGYAAAAGTRVEGQSAEEYTFYSIVRPAQHLVNGFSNLMYTEYDVKLQGQDIADLIAYVLTL